MAGDSGKNNLILDVAIRIGEFIGGTEVKKGAEDAAKTFTEAIKDTATRNNVISKLFPQLGLEVGENGQFTQPSRFGAASKVTGDAADGTVKMLKTGLGILEDIYKRLEQASPLLQAVESLFNLAMQLFFMPLGNKLGEELIPAALEMIDDVMAMWDEMKDMNIDQILQKTMDRFTDVFIGFMNNIGTRLEKHGGLLGAIGSLIKTIGGLAQTFLPLFIGFTANLMTFIGQNFAWIVGSIVAFKILHHTLMLAQIAATLVPGVAKVIAGAGVGLAIVGGIAAGVATAIAGHADGGYVASPQLALLGEGGEGEWIVPDSKVSDFVTGQAASRNLKVSGVRGGGGDNFTVNVYGYTDRELGGIIEDKVNELSNRSRLRSGF